MKKKSLTFKDLLKRYNGILSLVEKQNAKKFKRIKKLENIKPKDEEKLTNIEIASRRRDALTLRGEIDETLENLKMFLDESYSKVKTLLDDSKKSVKKKAKYEKLPEITKLTEGHEILEKSKNNSQREVEVEELQNIEDSSVEYDRGEDKTYEENNLDFSQEYDEVDISEFSSKEPSKSFVQEQQETNRDEVLNEPTPLEGEPGANPYDFINTVESNDNQVEEIEKPVKKSKERSKKKISVFK